MTHLGGRPKGTTGHSDCKLLWVFLRKKNMRFSEAVRESGLARGTTASCLKRFISMGLMAATMKGKRPVYRLIKPELAEKRILVPEMSKRRARLAKLLPRLDKAIQLVKRDIDRRRYEEKRIPAVLKKFEEWAWSKVPEGMAYEDYWGYHSPSSMALIYALKKYPQLLEEELLQRQGAELEKMMRELKKIREFENIIRRQKAMRIYG